MRTLVTLTILVVIALAAAATSAAWTPTRAQLKERRIAVMDKRHDYCLHTWDLKPLPAELTPSQLRWKWSYWQGVRDRTNEKGPSCTPVQIGRRMALDRYGWGDSQFVHLYDPSETAALWERESGWNPCRRYPSTTDCGYGPFPWGGGSACGIPQFVPCSKLIGYKRELGDVSAREQIRKGLDYIKGRYGSPAAANAHSHAYGWY